MSIGKAAKNADEPGSPLMSVTTFNKIIGFASAFWNWVYHHTPSAK